MDKKYIEENKELFKFFVENSFFKNWRLSKRGDIKYHNYNSLTLDIDYSCDLKCEYCYLKRFGKELYHNKTIKKDNLIKNTEKIMNFIYKNNMYCLLEIFSGEPFRNKAFCDILDIIYDYQSKMPVEKRSDYVSIPSNLSIFRTAFKKDADKFIEYQKKFEEISINLVLSASVDGPFMDDENRPRANKEKYDRDFYNNVLDNGDKFGYGYHPMIYSNNIEYWIDNFLWFDNNIRTSLYLLEIRNQEWTEKQAHQLYYFTRFLVNYIYNALSNKNTKEFRKILEELKGYNIINSVFSTIGRGIGCSIQSSFEVILNDLTLIPCHRTSYDTLTTGKLSFNDGDWDIEIFNPELYIAIQTAESKNMGPCEACPINEICSGPCLGANLESTGELFTTSPTVCKMEYEKIAGIIRGFDDIGLLNLMTKNTAHIKKAQIYNVLREDLKRNRF